MKFKGGAPAGARRSWSRSALAAGTGMVACLLMAMQPAHAAKPAPVAPVDTAFAVQAQLLQQTGGELYTFYSQRAYRPLWLDSHGTPTKSANALLELLDTSEYDGLDPARLNVAGVKAALQNAAAAATPVNLSRAELALANAFVAYAQALRSSANTAMVYEHDNLRPRALSPYHLLEQAAAAPSLDDYVTQMKWMHPLYAPLRRSLFTAPATSDAVRQTTINTLARLRGIPTAKRQIIVDVASARLWMYEDGQPVDSMRVVVGRTTDRTPMLAGYIRYAILNPYWNVPDTLVVKNIAPKVLQRSTAYLTQGGYQVLSDWSANAELVDPRKIDWKAAARGELDLRIRQLPRPGNAMGRVKYEFPNQFGIYLHDTPDKNLMEKDARQFSAGCIRLEDAERLGRWLMHGDLPAPSSDPEYRVDLPSPVPIYLTYLTAHAEQGQVVLGPDPYGLDAEQRPALAARDGGTTALAR